jgi:hypothetical protein
VNPSDNKVLIQATVIIPSVLWWWLNWTYSKGNPLMPSERGYAARIRM